MRQFTPRPPRYFNPRTKKFETASSFYDAFTRQYNLAGKEVPPEDSNEFIEWKREKIGLQKELNSMIKRSRCLSINPHTLIGTRA